MARKTVVRRLSKRLPSLDDGDEELKQAIERVDELYPFGKSAASPAPTIEGAIEPNEPPVSGRDQINRDIPLEPEPPPGAAAAPPRTKPSVGEWLENTIKPLLAQAQSFGGIDLVLDRDDVRAALGSAKFSDAHRQALNALVADARLRVGETAPVQADVPEGSDDWPGPDVPAAAPVAGSL